MNIIQMEWDMFNNTVLKSVNPSPTQSEEMKKAFYAGAIGITMAITGLATQDIPNEDGATILQGIFREADEFFVSLEKGKS